MTLTAPRTVTLAAFRRGVRVTIRPSEAARLEIALEGTITNARISAFNATLAKRTLGLADGWRSVTLEAEPPRGRHAAQALGKVRVRVVASDAAGNRRTATRTITVRR